MSTDIEKTLELLRKEDEEVSLTELYNLSDLLGEEKDLLDNAWATMDVTTRRRVVRELADLAESDVYADFTAVFRRAVDDPDPEVRAQAIDGLWENENVSLMFKLLEILHEDEVEAVRARAAAGLGRFVLTGELGHLSDRGLSRIVEALYETIEDGRLSTELRRRAVESIAYSSDERVRGVINRAIQAPHRKMRVSAIFAMGRSADKYWCETVREYLESDDAEMRYEAARAAGELEDAGAVDSLTQLVSDTDSEVRQAAIWSLGQIGGKRARRVLERLVTHKDPLIAEAAEEAMAMLKLSAGVFDPGSFVDISFDTGDAGVEDATEIHSFSELDQVLGTPTDENDEEDDSEDEDWREPYDDAYDDAYDDGYADEVDE